MPNPKALELTLSDEEKAGLSALIKRHKAGQLKVRRARIVLATGIGKSNSQVMKEENVSLSMVRKWRSRWAGLQPLALTELSIAERLEDLPRAGKPPRITAEQRCKIQQLACEQPEASQRPISHWTHREVAEEIVKRGIVSTISARHAGRLLKKGP